MLLLQCDQQLFGTGSDYHNKLTITITCPSVNDAHSVFNLWQRSEERAWYQYIAYSIWPFSLRFADPVQWDGEYTIQVTGFYTGQTFLEKFETVLERIPFTKATIGCNDDKDPKKLSQEIIQEMVGKTYNSFDSVYTFTKIDGEISLL